MCASQYFLQLKYIFNRFKSMRTLVSAKLIKIRLNQFDDYVQLTLIIQLL